MVPIALILDRSLRPLDRDVWALAAFDAHVAHRGDLCTLRPLQLAETLGVTDRSIRSSLERLDRSGWIRLPIGKNLWKPRQKSCRRYTTGLTVLQLPPAKRAPSMKSISREHETSFTLPPNPSVKSISNDLQNDLRDPRGYGEAESLPRAESQPQRRACPPAESSQGTEVTRTPRYARQLAPAFVVRRHEVYDALLEVWPDGVLRDLSRDSFASALLQVLSEYDLPQEDEATLLDDLYGEILRGEHDWSLIHGTGFLVARFRASVQKRGLSAPVNP